MISNEEVDFLSDELLYRLAPKTTIVITVPWSELADEAKTQLVKITEALRTRINPALSLDAFRVVHVPQLDLSTWSEKPERLIYFGQPVKGLPFYEVIEAGATRMVLAGSLSELIPDEPARTKLWQSLRQLFA